MLRVPFEVSLGKQRSAAAQANIAPVSVSWGMIITGTGFDAPLDGHKRVFGVDWMAPTVSSPYENDLRFDVHLTPWRTTI